MCSPAQENPIGKDLAILNERLYVEQAEIKSLFLKKQEKLDDSPLHGG